MWRDVEWHQRLTEVIKSTPIKSELINDKIIKALM
jgi:hypothetical protein